MAIALRPGAVPPTAMPLSRIVGPFIRLNAAPLPKCKNNKCGGNQEDDCANPLGHHGAPRSLCGPRLFRVALRSQPVDAAGSLHPFVDFGFALEPLDISRLGSRIFSEDLPIILGDPLHFEGDSGFAHTIEYAPSAPGRKP